MDSGRHSFKARKKRWKIQRLSSNTVKLNFYFLIRCQCHQYKHKYRYSIFLEIIRIFITHAWILNSWCGLFAGTVSLNFFKDFYHNFMSENGLWITCGCGLSPEKYGSLDFAQFKCTKFLQSQERDPLAAEGVGETSNVQKLVDYC